MTALNHGKFLQPENLSPCTKTLEIPMEGSGPTKRELKSFLTNLSAISF